MIERVAHRATDAADPLGTNLVGIAAAAVWAFDLALGFLAAAVDELRAMLLRHAEEMGYSLDIFSINVEREAINRIYRAVDEGFNGLVMNPAGYSYAGYALKDCVKGAVLLDIEIHISNIHKRRIDCVLSDASAGTSGGSSEGW